jgi:hypothetical protein
VSVESAPDPRLLVVRHGAGRGRLDGYMQPVLDALFAREPGLRARILVHETGGPPPLLDGVVAVLFWLADPLREWYPDCFAEAAKIAGDARARGVRLVNPPESLSNSVKSRQARLWVDAGIETPPYRRFADAGELRALAPEIGFPLVIRSDEHHLQKGMQILADADALARLDPASLVLPGAVAPLWDTRRSWRWRRPWSPYARLHHKKRLYVLGDRVRTEHVFFSRDPIVSARSSTFTALHEDPRGAARELARRHSLDARTMREDLRYWEAESVHADLMRRATSILGLEFAAIDYSDRGDGGVMIWEANPHPYLPPLQRMRLPERRRARERLASYERAIGDFLARLLGERSAP